MSRFLPATRIIRSPPSGGGSTCHRCAVAYTATVVRDRSPDLDPGYDDAVDLLAKVLSAVLQRAGCPPITVEIVWAPFDEFASAVQEAMDASGSTSPRFTTERLGGQVVGKNIPQDDDHARVTIVMIAPVAGPVSAQVVFLLAHEMVHPVLNRLRAASGRCQMSSSRRRPPARWPGR